MGGAYRIGKYAGESRDRRRGGIHFLSKTDRENNMGDDIRQFNVINENAATCNVLCQYVCMYVKRREFRCLLEQPLPL